METGDYRGSSWISASRDRLENSQSLGYANLYPRSPYTDTKLGQFWQNGSKRGQALSKKSYFQSFFKMFGNIVISSKRKWTSSLTITTFSTENHYNFLTDVHLYVMSLYLNSTYWIKCCQKLKCPTLKNNN